MDNRVFNVNGRGDDLLLNTLRLVFSQRGSTARSWDVTSKGFILFWSKEKNSFPIEMDANEVFPIIKKWLESKEAEKIELKGRDMNVKLDGSTARGWRVFLTMRQDMIQNFIKYAP